MAGPPNNIPASDLWIKLSSLERPNKLVDFPRFGEDGEPIGQVRIQVLTQLEQAACTKAAEELARKHLKEAKQGDIGYERLFSDAFCVEVLWRACRNPDKIMYPAFPTPNDMRDKMTTDQCAMLFEHYLTVQHEFGPTALSMSGDDVEAWIDRLAEAGSAFPFSRLSSEMQQVLVLHMAFALRPLLKDSASSGSPQTDGSTEPETPNDEHVDGDN